MTNLMAYPHGLPAHELTPEDEARYEAMENKPDTSVKSEIVNGKLRHFIRADGYEHVDVTDEYNNASSGGDVDMTYHLTPTGTKPEHTLRCISSGKFKVRNLTTNPYPIAS